MTKEMGNKVLDALLIVFDSKVLLIENGKYQFSGKIFEYKFRCEANDEHELIQKIGDFLMGIPKYMWILKSQSHENEEN